MNRLLVCVFLGVIASHARSWAIPPIVSGDVPTADKGAFELYVGTRFQSTDGEHDVELPVAELVYGVNNRLELTIESAYVSEGDEHGWGDLVLGTKLVLVKESEKIPGIAGSFELKIPTASESRGLGSGEFDYDLRLRTQKTWGRYTAMGNVGYTFITEPETNGVTQDRDNVWFVSGVQQYSLTEKTTLLGEVYWESADEPGGADRIAANLGFKHRVSPNLSLLGAVGRSVRRANEGGPGLRVFAGLKLDFAAPWTKNQRREKSSSH